MLQLIVGVDFIAVNRPVSLEAVQPQLTVNKPLIYANPLSVQWSEPAEEWMNHNLSVPPVDFQAGRNAFFAAGGSWNNDGCVLDACHAHNDVRKMDAVVITALYGRMAIACILLSTHQSEKRQKEMQAKL